MASLARINFNALRDFLSKPKLAIRRSTLPIPSALHLFL